MFGLNCSDWIVKQENENVKCVNVEQAKEIYRLTF